MCYTTPAKQQSHQIACDPKEDWWYVYFLSIRRQAGLIYKIKQYNRTNNNYTAFFYNSL